MFDYFKQKFSSKFLIGLLSLFGSLIGLFVFSFPDDRLHLIFCDVGQGDATLISQGSNQILIDGGPNDKVLQCLANNMPFFDKTIEIVILTHPEADHLTGLLSVIEKYKINYFFTGPEGNNSALYTTFNEKLKEKSEKSQLKIKNIYTGETVKIDNISLKSLWPERNFVMEKLSNIAENSNQGLSSSSVLGMQTGSLKLNQFSLVFLLKYNNFSAILMGDADQTVQNDILLFNSLIPLDILKFPHHGSKTGMSENFLQIIKPKEAVISVGKNSYGHPTTEAMDLLKKYGVKIRRTDLEGEIDYSFN